MTAIEQKNQIRKNLQYGHRFKKLYESIPYGIARTDLDGNIIEANQAFVNMLGFQKMEQVCKSFLHFTPEKYHEFEMGKIMHQLIDRGFSDEYKKEYIRKDGTIVHVSIKAWRTEENNPEIWAIVCDITEQQKTKARLQQMIDTLKGLNQYTVDAREEERRSIAAAIHDEIGSTMTALNLQLGLMLKHLDNKDQLREKITQMTELTTSLTKKMQRISGDLRPGILDSLGLTSAIEWYCGEWEEKTGKKTHIELDSCYLKKPVELALFRIFQEALTNVTRHAKASSVIIRLEHKKQAITLSIKDDGIGIPKEKIDHIQSFGLMGMRERAAMAGGDLYILDKGGTTIKVVIPFF